MNKLSAYLLLATAVATPLAASGCGRAPDTTAATSAASPIAGNVPDIAVTEQVKTALRQHDSLRGLDIKVVTLKGDVRLIGALDSQSQIDEAIKIARAADGTLAIHDDLTIRR